MCVKSWVFGGQGSKQKTTYESLQVLHVVNIGRILRPHLDVFLVSGQILSYRETDLDERWNGAYHVAICCFCAVEDINRSGYDRRG